MESKTCTICNLEKHIIVFYKKDSGCEICNSKRGLSRYYEKKDKRSNQRKTFYEKNKKDKLIQKQNDRFIQFKKSVRTRVELENRFKTMKEKCSKNNSKNIFKFYQRNLFKTTLKSYPANETDVYHIDDIWSLDVLDLRTCGPQNNRG